MKALFLDFDGVVIDSIEECFVLSYELYYGLQGNEENFKNIRSYFYKYRGIVRPAYQYLSLMKSINKKLSSEEVDVIDTFHDIDNATRDEDRDRFEYLFFSLRKYYQNDKEKWIKNNPLTSYGATLVNKDLASTYIITTKNIESVNLILEKYNISVAGIYDKDAYSKYGDKGSIIKAYLDNQDKYEKVVFVDDAVEHLDTVNDSRVETFFADWGYGKNTNYEVFTEDMWVLGG